MQDFFHKIASISKVYLTKKNIVSISSLVFASAFAILEYKSYIPTAGDDSYPDILEGPPEDADQDTEDDACANDAPLTSKNPLKEKAVDEEATPREKLLVVGKGDTLNSLLISTGLSKAQAQLVVDAVTKVYNPKQLKIGQGIKVGISKDPLSDQMTLETLEWRSAPDQEIIVHQNGGKFFAKKETIQLKRSVEGVAGRIKSSFYNAAVKLGAPSNLVKSAIQALSYEVNFQHDPKPGHAFAILYEVYRDNKGNFVKYGNLLYAAFAPGRLCQVYRFEGPSGVTFYNQNGECMVKGLLRSPLDVTKLRINSGYGFRLHPIKNYTIFHQGIDFAAKPGTRVVAAGNGVVTKSQYWGGFGLYISIKHGDYTTEYAHLRKIAPGIRVGTKVTQGQFIAESGSTGSSTGPHLHYGLLYKGKHVNPNSVKTVSSHKLNKKDMLKFTSFKKTIESKVTSSPSEGQYVLALKDTVIG